MLEMRHHVDDYYDILIIKNKKTEFLKKITKKSNLKFCNESAAIDVIFYQFFES